MKNNTVSSVETRILRGVELIDNAMDGFKGISTENWAYPVCKCGEHYDSYYGEIWANGMD